MRFTSVWKIGLGLLAAVVVVLAPGGSRASMTCALCRTTRVEEKFGLVTWENDTPNDCSRWYEAHVEPRHSHIWQKGSCRYFWTLFGSGVACGRSAPIRHIPPEIQLKFYQGFRDPRDAKQVFLTLSERTFYEQTIDEHDYPGKGYVMADAIESWVAHDSPGTWADWWAKAWKDHVDEHDRLAKWHQSNATLK